MQRQSAPYYEHRPEPHRTVGAAMMIAKPGRSARAFASEFGVVVVEVSINGTPDLLSKSRADPNDVRRVDPRLDVVTV